MYKKLDVGCGKSKLSDHVGIDKIKLSGVDIIHDLEQFPYPIKDDEFDEIFCSHTIEHLQDIIKTVEEFYRILKPDGLLRIKYPYCKSNLAYCDPTHKHYLSENAFDLFDKEDFHNYYTKAKFKIIRKELYYNTPGKYLKFMPSFLRKILKHFIWNMYDGVYIELRAVKTPVKK